MKYLQMAPVFLAAAVGSMSSAFAGVSGAVVTDVKALSAPVTYSTTGTKGLSTRVGYEVTITRSGTNTVNNVVFQGTTSIVAPVGFTPSGPAEFVEANNDNGACRVGATPTEVVCNFGQLRAEEFRTFAVFFKGPVESAGNCFEKNLPSCEVVRFAGATNYSEGSNDGTGSFPNDASPFSVDVDLGTNDPTRVKSAVSKSGGTLFTGSDGVPNSLTDFKFASKLNVPNPPNYASVEINLKKFLSTSQDADDQNQVAFCNSAGNFYNCYQASIIAPAVTYTFGGNTYLTVTLRIDAAEVKANPFKTENVKVYFQSDVNPLFECDKVTELPPPGEERCVQSITRYGNQGFLGDLRRDVEIVIHAYKNAIAYKPR